MRLLGIDFETTGLSLTDDRITEVGVAVWDTTEKAPRVTANAFFYDEAMEARFTPESIPMMKRVCGITPELLREIGDAPVANLQWIHHLILRHKVDAIVAHNGTNFDKPLLMEELKRHGAAGFPELPWIDTKTDLPFEDEPASRKLVHLCLDAGFLNPFPHRALFDVVSMLKLLSGFDIEKVLEESKKPWAVVRAVVSYEDRELAKKAYYSWERAGDKAYPKMWVKMIRADKVQAEIQAQKFQVVVL